MPAPCMAIEDIPAVLTPEISDGAVEEVEEFALERVRSAESSDGVFPLSKERRPEIETWMAGRTGTHFLT
jgi:hypothetical protein